MTVHGRRRAHYGTRTPDRLGLAVVAVGLGIAVANGHGVAWAGPGPSDTSGSPADQSTSQAGPKKPGHGKRPDRSTTGPQGRNARDGNSAPADGAADTGSKTGGSSATQTDPTAAQSNSANPAADPADLPRTRSTARFARPFDLSTPNPLTRIVSRVESELAAAFSAAPRPDLTARAETTRGPQKVLANSPTSLPSIATALVSPAASATTTATTSPTPTPNPVTSLTAALVSPIITPTIPTPVTRLAPSPPGPLSPIAEIAAAPGRIVNAVLQVLDITTAVDGPRSPIDFDPIDEALWATFRRLEEVVGLYKAPTVQPVLLHQTYDGPTDGRTPTVQQFLNAAAGEYVLGGEPGGLKPFTVDGKQLTSTNILSGQASKAWVTPEGQIIIAYQGTTGGTNLLFNPLIAISQVLTDAQIIFTNTTPQAFTDALAFEREVEAAAAAQGYSKSDIFVTGHSLGGWEAQYVAQQTGLGGIGFESPGISSTKPGNGIESGFVNIETYGDPAAYMSSDLPGLQPFAPAYVPGGGSKPHYGSIIMIGDPNEALPLMNASSLFGPNLIGSAIFAVVLLGNFFEHHLPGVQAYNLGVTPDPGVVPWLGAPMGPVNATWANMTIPQLKKAASDANVLIVP